MGNFEQVFYASGLKGKSVRADSNGGTLARGWYVRKVRSGGYGSTHGPYPTKTAANLVAFGTARET